MMTHREINTRPKILVFCRNYLIPDFHDIFDPLLEKYDIKYLTDQYCKLGTEDTRKPFYALLRIGKRSPELDQNTENDVIGRCRMLRNLNREQSSRMVHAMANVIGGVIEKTKPDLIFTHMVDEYILHLFYILAARRKIPYASYCGSYFPGHALIFDSQNGSALSFRLPEEAEVQKILEQISPVAFRQNYNQVKSYSIWQHLKLMTRYTAKKIIFLLKSVIENDPWGMHYNILPYIADRRRLTDFPNKDNFANDWQSELSELTSNFPEKLVLYIPLAYSPEATTDYWIENTSIIDYDKKIIEIIKTLALNCVVLVKEHAHMMGARDVSLHRALKSMDSVISIHPNALGNEVLLRSDAVILGGGSVGVEAFLRDRPVFSYCKNAYWFNFSKANYLDLDNIPDWANQIKKAIPSFSPANPEEKKKFVLNCLKSTIRTRPNGRRWPLLDTIDLDLLVTNLVSKT